MCHLPEPCRQLVTDCDWCLTSAAQSRIRRQRLKAGVPVKQEQTEKAAGKGESESARTDAPTANLKIGHGLCPGCLRGRNLPPWWSRATSLMTRIDMPSSGAMTGTPRKRSNCAPAPQHATTTWPHVTQRPSLTMRPTHCSPRAATSTDGPSPPRRIFRCATRLGYALGQRQRAEQRSGVAGSKPHPEGMRL